MFFPQAERTSPTGCVSAVPLTFMECVMKKTLLATAIAMGLGVSGVALADIGNTASGAGDKTQTTTSTINRTSTDTDTTTTTTATDNSNQHNNSSSKLSQTKVI